MKLASSVFSKPALDVDLVERPDGFDIEDFIAQGALQFGGEQSFRLEARIGRYQDRVLSETPLAEDQKLEGGMLTHGHSQRHMAVALVDTEPGDRD